VESSEDQNRGIQDSRSKNRKRRNKKKKEKKKLKKKENNGSKLSNRRIEDLG